MNTLLKPLIRILFFSLALPVAQATEIDDFIAKKTAVLNAQLNDLEKKFLKNCEGTAKRSVLAGVLQPTDIIFKVSKEIPKLEKVALNGALFNRNGKLVRPGTGAFSIRRLNSLSVTASGRARLNSRRYLAVDNVTADLLNIPKGFSVELGGDVFLLHKNVRCKSMGLHPDPNLKFDALSQVRVKNILATEVINNLEINSNGMTLSDGFLQVTKVGDNTLKIRAPLVQVKGNDPALKQCKSNKQTRTGRLQTVIHEDEITITGLAIQGFLKEEENVHIFFSGRTARQQNFNINTQVNLQGGISVPPVISPEFKS
ncbi:MAG: hypothetical protein HOM11_16535 [Methylococcales bacterium]|nr:hypothetical protein [Methylococcales bacterium]